MFSCGYPHLRWGVIGIIDNIVAVYGHKPKTCNTIIIAYAHNFFVNVFHKWAVVADKHNHSAFFATHIF